MEVKIMNTQAGCRFIGEFLEQGEVPEALSHLRKQSASNSEVERPRIVASYLDHWHKPDSEKEFKVLLADQRVVTVRGHSLKYLQNSANPTDHGSYGIILRSGEQECWLPCSE